MRMTNRRALAAALTLAGALAATTGATAATDVTTVLGVVDQIDDYALSDAVEELGLTARAAYPRTFGGLHRDPESGVVTLSFTRDGAASVARLAAGFPRPDLLRLRAVDHTLADLDAVLARITADVPRLRGFAYAYVDVPANAVTVAFATVTPPSMTAYGPAVLVTTGDPFGTTQSVPDVCQGRDLCAPYLRGGIEMKDGTGICTSGFAARKNGQPAMITAGHCFQEGAAVSLGGAPLGTVVATQFAGTVDGQVIVPPEAWQLTNWVYWTATDTEHKIRSIAKGEAVGNRVCRVGRTSATTKPACGAIVTTNATLFYPSGEVLTEMRMARTCGIPGDSGGPVMYGSKAYGVLSGGNHKTNGDGTYSCNSRPLIAWSGIGNVQRALGVQVYFGS